MEKLIAALISAALLAGSALAQTPAQPTASAAPASTKIQFAPGTIIRIELAKSIDAKKAKAGDEVVGKTMDDFLSDHEDVLAPKGSKVLAHVTEATPHQGDSASTLGIAFDRMVLKDGADVPLKAAIQAIGPPESTVAVGGDPMGGGSASGMPSTPSGGRGASGGMAPMSGGSSANPGATTQDSGYPAPRAAINGRLTPSAQGVVGISGLSLSAGSAGLSQLTAQKRNVKLDGGTQMILRVTE